MKKLEKEASFFYNIWYNNKCIYLIIYNMKKKGDKKWNYLKKQYQDVS